MENIRAARCASADWLKKSRLSTFVVQIQSEIDAADEGKMNLNTVSVEDLQSLANAINQIISK